MPAKAAGRTKVRPVLAPLPANRFYAGIKKKSGPKRQLLSEKLRAPPRPVENPYQSYTVSYRLRVLSYWETPSIPIGPTKLRKPMRIEVMQRFQIPGPNLTRWRKEEAEGKYLEHRKSQQRDSGGGRKTKWEEMEKKLYDQFRVRRATGGFVRRGWFRQVSKAIFGETYPAEPLTNFAFSNGWFRGFLGRHRISLRVVTNKSSQLPSDFGEEIVNWMRFNRGNSQLRPDDERGLGDSAATIGRYCLSNIVNMDQTPLPFQYLEGQTYNNIGDRTIWVQGSQSGWDKRQGTVQLTVCADGVPRIKPLVFFRGLGVGGGILKEKESYDSRVDVKFNPKAYANTENFLQWIEEQLIPALDNRPTILALDLFAAHKTEEVLDTFFANDITVSLIPGGCTSLVQPLDVSINRPFKDILKVKKLKLTSPCSALYYILKRPS